jgi:2,4-dienoyl-CoA reductase-like NADH-dependent reductase (Old Yellow Enzyme family)
VNGWPDNGYGPSAISYNSERAQPKAMTLADIDSLKAA